MFYHRSDTCVWWYETADHTEIFRFLNDLYLNKTTSVTSLADIQMGTQLTADFEILATSRPVLEEVIEKLNLDYTYEELKSMIQTDNQTDTRILRFTVLMQTLKKQRKLQMNLRM